MTENVVYHKVEAYPMKCRLYLTKKQAETVDEWMLGLWKAYNITLYALKTGDRRIMQESKPDKSGNTAWFPDFRKMAAKAWLDYLRVENAHVACVPSAALSSSVGGLFLSDMKRAWEKQGKLPVKNWFDKKDNKGHSVIRWYSERKPRRSVYFQIASSHLKREGKTVFAKFLKIGKVKLRGWNEKIKPSADSFSDLISALQENKKQLGCRIEKDTCGDYFAVISLRNVYRPFRESSKRHDIGIDVGIHNMLADSDGNCYQNPKYKKQVEKQLDYYNTCLSRQFGPTNKDYRTERKNKNKWNESHRDEIDAGKVEVRTINPSRHYLETKRKKARLERKVKRKRELLQHRYSSSIVNKASMIGIESLSVTGMLKNDNVAKELSDAAMSSQLMKLKYKAEWSGVNLQEVGELYPSTQICSKCGYELTGDERLKLGDRTFSCPVCGYEIESDINAAQTIKSRARFMLDKGIKPEKLKKEKKLPKDHEVFKDRSDIVVHFSMEMKQNYKNPYIVINTETGEILDDAQGEGYRTIQNAKKAWRYKNKQKQIL